MTIRRKLALILAALVAGPIVAADSAMARGGGGGKSGRSMRNATKQDKTKKKDLELQRERLRQVDYRGRDSSADRSAP